MRRLRAAGPILLLAAAGIAGAPPAGGDEPATGTALVADLRAAVEKATPAERAAAADALARRPGVSIDAWREAANALRPAVPAESGERSQTVTLRVLAADEATEIVTYVPAVGRVETGPAGSRPLVLALHGSGGRGADMTDLWKPVADATGAVVVAPTEAGENAGYRFSPRERAATLAALRWARLRFDVDPDRVLVTGQSRGGHLTWDLVLRRPGTFAAAAPMIGAPRLATQGGQNNLRFLENVVDLPIRDLQGARDDPRAVSNVRFAFERLASLSAADAKLVEFAERGHDFDFEAVDWAALLRDARRDANAARVVLRAAVKGESRARWVEALEFDPTVQEDPKIPQPSGWDHMEEAARRKFVEAEVEKRTARLEVVRQGPGRFEAKSTGVARFRLWLEAGAVGDAGAVTVTWNGKVVKRTVVPSAAVLLREFVERVDRAFLPVAEVVIP